jgi:hypothetical protein
MKFYTVPEIAAMFHRTEGVIRAWLRNGYFPGTKVQSGWLISQSQLDAFLAMLAAS